MGLIPAFKGKDIKGKVDRFVDKKEENAVKVFQFVGESFVNDAREIGEYNDVTGNLRSSVGYVVAVGGETVSEDVSGGDNPKAEGTRAAKRMTNKLKKGKGVVLVGVAGMSYGSDVEKRGKNVITASQIKARELLKKLIKAI